MYLTFYKHLIQRKSGLLSAAKHHPSLRSGFWLASLAIGLSAAKDDAERSEA